MQLSQAILSATAFILAGVACGAELRIQLRDERGRPIAARLEVHGADGNRRHVWQMEKYVWAVQAAARCVPRATCLTQALALRRVLASAGVASTIRIGVARERDRNFEAHAWVEVDGRILIGGNQTDRHTPIYSVSGR